LKPQSYELDSDIMIERIDDYINLFYVKISR